MTTRVKVTELPSISTLSIDDIFSVSDDPSGSPISKKASMQKIVDLLEKGYFARQVDSVTDLASEAAAAGYTRIVNDLDRGGVFKAVNSGTANDGTIFASATAGWTWQRLYSGAVNVRWFGAIGDGVTDDTDAIQSALNNFYDVYIPEGSYLVSARHQSTIDKQGLVYDYALKIPNSRTIKGVDGQTNIFTNQQNTSIFSSDQTFANNINLYDLTLTGSQSSYSYPSGSCGIRIGNEVGNQNGQIVYLSNFENLRLRDFSLNGIRLLNEFSNTIKSTQSNNSKGHQFVIFGGVGTSLENCYAGTVPTDNKCGFRIINRINLYDCNGTSTESSESSTWGWFGNKSAGNDPELNSGIGFYYAEIQLIHCNIEHWVTRGITLDEEGSLSFENCTFIQNGSVSGYLIYIDSNSVGNGDIYFKNCRKFPTGGFDYISCDSRVNVICDSPVTVYRRNSEYQNNRVATAFPNWSTTSSSLEQYAPYNYSGKYFIDQIAFYNPSISDSEKGRIIRYIEERGEDLNGGYDGRAEELFIKKTEVDLTSSLDLFSVDFTEKDSDYDSGAAFSKLEVDITILRQGFAGGYYSQKIIIDFGTISQAISSDSNYFFNNITNICYFEKAGPATSNSIGTAIDWTATQKTVKNTNFTVSISIPVMTSWAYYNNVDILTCNVKSVTLRKFGGLKITRL